MTEFIIKNIMINNNVKYFIDLAYYSTTPNNKKFKF